MPRAGKRRQALAPQGLRAAAAGGGPGPGRPLKPRSSRHRDASVNGALQRRRRPPGRGLRTRTRRSSMRHRFHATLALLATVALSAPALADVATVTVNGVCPGPQPVALQLTIDFT